MLYLHFQQLDGLYLVVILVRVSSFPALSEHSIFDYLYHFHGLPRYGELVLLALAQLLLVLQASLLHDGREDLLLVLGVLAQGHVADLSIVLHYHRPLRRRGIHLISIDFEGW